MKKPFSMSRTFLILYATICLPLVILILVLTANGATAEGMPGIEPTSVSISDTATIYHFTATRGTEFNYSVLLPKRIPATGQAGETVIDSTVFTVDEADLHLLDDPRLNDWVEVVETNTLENDNVEVLFYIAVPGDLPAGDYEFTAITDGLDLDIGTTVLHFIIK